MGDVMTGLPQTIDDMLVRVNEQSRREVDLVRRLSDAIRRADEQTLREMRNVTLQHEMRREAIFGEMQNLAARLCALPARARMTAIAQPVEAQAEPEAPLQQPVTEAAVNGGGYWRQAAQKIDDELEFTFNGAGRAH